MIHARHGSSSQLILAFSNLLGSIISLMVNFTAAGALVSVLSPLSFQTGVIIAGVGVLSYTPVVGLSRLRAHRLCPVDRTDGHCRGDHSRSAVRHGRPGRGDERF
ncbi:hypothetical protein MBH78_16190 [Oceanimonas sp. NS1]|nr:hypothetical protein [Oceanimonas sp. NS1]